MRLVNYTVMLIGLVLLTLGFLGAGLAIWKTSKQILSPTKPTYRTQHIAEILKDQFGPNYSYIMSILPYIQSASYKYGVDPALILAIIAQESRGNPRAVSKAGAIGLMQVMPYMAKRLCGYTRYDLFDPVKNIDCGTKLLSYLKGRVETLQDIIASYYAGEKAYRYRKKYGYYPSYGSPPVWKYVNDVYNRYKKLVAVV